MRELDASHETFAVRFVTIGDRAKADAFCGPYGAASLCLPDETKATYRAMGLGDFNLLRSFTDRALVARRAENKAAGFAQNWKATRLGDAAQLPGAAVIDAAGILRYVYRGAHAGDLPPMRELLERSRAALALDDRA